MNFSPAKYSSLKSRLKSRYQRDLAKALKAFKKDDSQLSVWVETHFQELKEYSEINWHLLGHLKTYIFFAEQPDTLGKNDFGPLEEEVFEKWNNSEFAKEFLLALNKGHHLGKASKMTLKVYERHLITFADRHLLKENKNSAAYRFQSSLGEKLSGKKITKLLETTLHLEGKDLRLMTSSLKEMKLFSNRIEVALKVIKKFSPSSWERFRAFTEVIIPIKQAEFVSYSHQDLPGHSMINLYHRDFVDLMDDLLHENGHHHLNYYLNLGTLISEPVDQIYYSPWRRTLRPLRGVYHAYFTFYWAFKLFADLTRAKEVDSIFYLFNDSEKEKIIWRVIEEYYMLQYTYTELKWAHKQKLIYDQGWNLILEQQKEVNKFKKYIPGLEKKLKSHKKDLKDLKLTLKKASRDFAKK